MMNAIDVIRIGRRRRRLASIAACTGCALPFKLARELDDQNGVLRRQTDQNDQADLREDVVVATARDRRP